MPTIIRLAVMMVNRASAIRPNNAKIHPWIDKGVASALKSVSLDLSYHILVKEYAKNPIKKSRKEKTAIIPDSCG